MGFFSNLFKIDNPTKHWAITLTTKTSGTFYVNNRGVNVCCAMDSSVSCGYTETEVAKVFNQLKLANPTWDYNMVEI